ncbi:MAG: COX15/CtaA family protein [Pseudorhodoplanes sp.]
MPDMPASSVDIAVRRRAVRLWLLIVAALMVVVVLVGGATRLTESGLSITEWRPLIGALPPLSAADWQDAFAKYKTIPQYSEINRGMSLDDFKTIFWWEWTHRFLARSVGVVFLLPFLFFLWRGWIERHLRARLWIIFAGGAALGAVGWWMVASGLSERVSVSQYRLAFHLTLACGIFAAIVWTAQRLRSRAEASVPLRVRRTAFVLVAGVVLQIYLGALVAGLDAGLTYNTWPLIDGHFIPASERLFFDTPLWRNAFENVLTVQFNHRMVAYALTLAVLLHVVDVMRNVNDRGVRRSALALAGVTALQVLLGIVTLLHQAPIGLALAHQGLAILLLTAAVIHAERSQPLRRDEEAAPRLAPVAAKT